ncbi:HAD family hydrolase [Halioxenophilus aromaticivorans]|uniref:N-acetylmuramic acid 6-phosphate phosphatase MupP n=1 Tax=Halioxenophilus aromaticivorans TaxID=1306992 RepID=A0AAV3U1B7_9ALTE
MNLEAVLFDLDGTLVDTAPDFIAVLNAMRVDHQQDPLPESTIRNTVSGGAREMVKLAFGGQPGEPKFDHLLQEFLQRYGDCVYSGQSKSVLFPGFDSLLATFSAQGIAWGIVTNKPARFAEALMPSLNITPASLVCPDHVREPKPAPEALLLACQQLQAEPCRTIYLGDHERDIVAGRNANMVTIAVAWGYFDEPDPLTAWQADHLVHTTQQLQQLLPTLF